MFVIGCSHMFCLLALACCRLTAGRWTLDAGHAGRWTPPRPEAGAELCSRECLTDCGPHLSGRGDEGPRWHIPWSAELAQQPETATHCHVPHIHRPTILLLWSQAELDIRCGRLLADDSVYHILGGGQQAYEKPLSAQGGACSGAVVVVIMWK